MTKVRSAVPRIVGVAAVVATLTGVTAQQQPQPTATAAPVPVPPALRFPK